MGRDEAAPEANDPLNRIRRVRLFGLQFAQARVSAVVSEVVSDTPSPNVRFVLPVNVDVLVKYRREPRDPAFRAACEGADLVVADGAPIVWASRILGRALPERVAGSDLMVEICGACARQGKSVFLLGGAPGIAEGAAQALRKRYPDLQVAGVCAPPMGFDEMPDEVAKAVSAVNTASPFALFVGLGAPRQEKWIHGALRRLHVSMVMPVGGAFDMLAGAVPRAPGWMQRAGLEWSWRLAHEPGRLWRRYLVEDAAFLKMLWSEWRG